MRLLSLFRSAPLPAQIDIDTVGLLTHDGEVVVPGDRGEDARCLTIMPLEGRLPVGAGQGACGVALVPEALDRAVDLNRAPLGSGLYLLRHRDALDVGGQRFWVASQAVAEEVDYDPERHGSDIFCARTRRRIHAGDLVVACPGTAAHGCELIFTATAWKAGVRCHQCGFDPNEKPWRPAAAPAARSARELLDRFRGRRGA